MHLPRRFTSLVPLLLSLIASAQQPANPANRTCTVSGTVVQLPQRTPVRKAQVAIAGMAHEGDAEKTYSALTDAEGHFEISGVPAGRYELEAKKAGFVGAGRGNSGDSRRLTLSAGQEIKDLSLALLVSAVVSGRVLDVDGDPVPGAHVTAERHIFMRGRKVNEPAGNETTDDNGEYRIHDLAPGRYYVVATPPGDLPVNNKANPKLRYAATYYPNTIDDSQAAPTDVRSGEEPRLDITLQQVEAVHVRGVLAGIAPGERAQIVLVGGAGESDAPDFRNIEAARGMFDIPNVIPGKYLLMVAVQTSDQKVRMQRQTIKVGPGGLDNVRVDLQQQPTGGATIRGVVRDVSPGKKPPLERMFLALQSTKEDDDDAFGGMFVGSGSMEVSENEAEVSAWTDSHVARVKADGTFEFRHVPPGTYLVGAGGAGPELRDYFTKTVEVGGRDVSDTGFTVRGGGAMSMDVTISANGGTIDGTVVDDKGKPAHDVSVVAIPTGARRKRWDLYVTGTTDQYGRFQLRGVSPGDYEVYAWDDVESEAYMDPDFLKPFTTKANAVKVEGGSRRTVQLPLLHSETSQVAAQ